MNYSIPKLNVNTTVKTFLTKYLKENKTKSIPYFSSQQCTPYTYFLVLFFQVKMILLIWLSVFLVLSCNGQTVNKYEHYLDDPAVQLFREYLQIDTSKAENIRMYCVSFCYR